MCFQVAIHSYRFWGAYAAVALLIDADTDTEGSLLSWTSPALAFLLDADDDSDDDANCAVPPPLMSVISRPAAARSSTILSVIPISLSLSAVVTFLLPRRALDCCLRGGDDDDDAGGGGGKDSGFDLIPVLSRLFKLESRFFGLFLRRLFGIGSK